MNRGVEMNVEDSDQTERANSGTAVVASKEASGRHSRRALKTAAALAITAGLALPCAFAAPSIVSAEPDAAIEGSDAVGDSDATGDSDVAESIDAVENNTSAADAVSVEAAAGDTGEDINPAPAKGSNPTALLTLEALDAKIQTELVKKDPVALAIKIKDGKLDQQGQLLLLQRYFINLAGYNAVEEFSTKTQEHSDFVQWFLTDFETLRLYVSGGAPGNKRAAENARKDPAARSKAHIHALDQLMELCRSYGDDIRPAVTTDATERAVFRKMMLSAALGMDGDTHLWAGNADNPADPVKRYKIIKTFREHHEQYHFKKALFDALPVEEMRYIFENRIDDEELPWLVNYTLNYKRNDKPLEENARLAADTYIYTDSKQGVHWIWDDPTFYDKEDIEEHATTLARPAQPEYVPEPVEGGWRTMYQFAYEDQNFPNKNESDPYYLSYTILEPTKLKELARQSKHPARLWMVLQRGGVCGAVAKTHENLNGSAGIPATVCAQPGHAATIKYQLKTNTATGKEEPYWSILNNMAGTPGYGWLELRTPESSHALCGWDEVHEGPWLVGDKGGKWYDEDTGNHMWVHWYGGPYTLLAQDVLNDFDNFVKVFELRALADSQKDDAVKLHIIEQAIAAQPFNQDALLAKCELLERKATSDEDWIAFADQVVKGYAEHPLPMHTMLKRIIQKASAQHEAGGGNTAGTDSTVKPGMHLRGQLEFMRIVGLKKALKVTEADDIQFLECQVLAKCLLDRKDGTAASFSYDGGDAGKIKLGIQLKDIQEAWQYSIDGGGTWVDVAAGNNETTLSKEEIKRINAENDLKVRMKGALDSGVYTIDISVAKAPERPTANDNNNRFYTAEIANEPELVSKYEAKVNGAWIPLKDAQPFMGNQTVEVRLAAHGTYLPSSSVSVKFTDNKEDEKKFIPYEQLKVDSYSSSQHGPGGANRVLNGHTPSQNGDGDIWHSTWSKEDDPWIAIDLGKDRDICAIDFWRRTGGNGIPQTIKVFIAKDAPGATGTAATDKDAKNREYTEVKEFTGEELKWENGKARLTFETPVRGRYIKLLNPVKNNYFSCLQMDFFEVPAPDPLPEPEPPVDPEPKPPVDPEPTPDPKPDPDLQPPVDPDLKPPVEPGPKPPVDPDPQPPVDPQPQPDPSPEPEPDPNPDPQPNPDPNPEPNPAPDPDQKPGVGQQGGAGDNQGKPEKPGNPGVSGSTLPQTGDASFIAPILASVATVITAVGVRMRRK